MKRVAETVGVALLMVALGTGAQAESADIVQMVSDGIQSAAQKGELLPLDLSGTDLSAVEVDGVVYGCEIKLFQTWLEAADAETWQTVGLEQPQGTLTWEALLQMAAMVEKHNQENNDDLLLIAMPEGRFSQCVIWADKEAERLQKVASEEHEERKALLTERVLSIEEVGAKRYVTGIEYDGQMIALAKREARCLALNADAKDAKGAQAELITRAQKEDPLVTGIFPEEMTYEQLEAQWPWNLAQPSEENMALWKQMAGI